MGTYLNIETDDTTLEAICCVPSGTMEQVRLLRKQIAEVPFNFNQSLDEWERINDDFDRDVHHLDHFDMCGYGKINFLVQQHINDHIELGDLICGSTSDLHHMSILVGLQGGNITPELMKRVTSVSWG